MEGVEIGNEIWVWAGRNYMVDINVLDMLRDWSRLICQSSQMRSLKARDMVIDVKQHHPNQRKCFYQQRRRPAPIRSQKESEVHSDHL